MLHGKTNFTYQKPNSDELSLMRISREHTSLKRNRSKSSNRRNKNKFSKKTIDSSTQRKLLKLIDLIDKSMKNDDENENESENENENENGSVSILEIIQNLFSQRGNVFREGSHIYYRGEVTMSGVNELCDLIQQINDESTHDDQDPIYLHITSMGGDLLAGYMAFDFIKNSTVPVYTIADGFAVSSGANMYMAGKKRFMRKHSYLLIHQLNQFRCERETSLNALDNAENVSEFMSKLYAMYLDNIRHHRENVPESDILTKEKLMLHMHHDIFWNYDTCLRYGLVDELYTNINDIEEKNKTQSQSQSQSTDLLLSLLCPNIKKNQKQK